MKLERSDIEEILTIFGDNRKDGTLDIKRVSSNLAQFFECDVSEVSFVVSPAFKMGKQIRQVIDLVVNGEGLTIVLANGGKHGSQADSE